MEINKIKEKIRVLVNHFNAGNLYHVIKETEKLLLKLPKNIFLINLIGSSYQRLGDNKKAVEDYEAIIKTLANVSSITFADSAEKAVSFIEKSDEVFVIIGDEDIDVEAELEKIDKEIKRLKGFIFGIDKKLSNERFVNNAPEQVIALENKKKADSESKIKALEESRAQLV